MAQQLETKNKILPEIIGFLRKKDYKAIKELGFGAFGRTVLLKDPVIDEMFVCKKYSPQIGINRKKYFKNFINEIKILHLLYNENVVRIFNYHIYEEIFTGYILMEYIDGPNIENFLQQSPELINSVFEQTINGFAYLESKNILHRDIRIPNILVNDSGFVKIIDFGFGKQTFTNEDFDKSISLNWWCDLPLDFQSKIYNFKTEIYFIGKLFEKIINENNIENFEYSSILKQMCTLEPENRIDSFSSIYTSLQKKEIMDLFDDSEKIVYRKFSEGLFNIIGSIGRGAKYSAIVEIVEKKIEKLHLNVCLAYTIPDNSALIRCFIDGKCNYFPKVFIKIDILTDFLNLLKSCSKDKKNIILKNIHSMLDSIDRIAEPIINDDEIPF